MIGKRNLVILTFVGVVAIAVMYYLSLPRTGPIERKWIAAASLSQVHTGKHFSATIQGVRYGPRSSITGTFEYVIIFVKTPDGNEMGLYQMHPESNTVVVVDSLIVGKAYEFPEALR